MKLPENIKSFSLLEIALLVVFVLYLIIPIQTPMLLAGIVNSPLGILGIFIITVFLFLYTNPILAIVYIFVGYELLRRSSAIVFIDSTPKVIKSNANNERVKEIVPLFKNEKVVSDSPKPTLEEEVVGKMAPIGGPPVSEIVPSTFKPVSENVGGASLA